MRTSNDRYPAGIVHVDDDEDEGDDLSLYSFTKKETNSTTYSRLMRAHVSQPHIKHTEGGLTRE